jgi:hypothetical protein
VYLSQLVITYQLNFQEMLKTVENARDATSQLKSQIKLKLDVFLDQELFAIALKELLMEDTVALNAQLVKLETPELLV